MKKHKKDIRKFLKNLEENQLVATPAKSAFFQREVEFFCHVIRQGVRKPSQVKILPLYKWEIPRTITELRGVPGSKKLCFRVCQGLLEVCRTTHGQVEGWSRECQVGFQESRSLESNIN